MIIRLLLLVFLNVLLNLINTTAISLAEFSALQKEEEKKQAWINFCDELKAKNKCPYLTSATAIPLATSLKRRANGTLNAVKVRFIVQSFQNIAELQQLFSLQGSFAFSWEMPECARWAEARDGERPNYCAIKRDEIWHPLFYHTNAVGKDSPFNTGVSQVTITNRGDAIWFVRGQFDSSCSLRFKNFPFDEQTCTVSLKWQQSGDAESVAIWPSLEVAEDAFSAGDVWRLVGQKTLSYYDQAREKQVDFVFKMRREPEAYVGNIFLPTMLLMVAQTSVFIIPPEMGDRTGFSVTLFLSSAVCLTLVAQLVPATAERMGIVILYAAQTAFGVAISIYTTITVRLAENYPKMIQEKTFQITLFKKKIKCSIINVIDTIAFATTAMIYTALCMVILGLMYFNPPYSPFYTEPPDEIIFQNDEVHRALGKAAAQGRVEEVERLLQLPGIDVNWWDEDTFSDCRFPAAYNPTALRRAVACNQTEVVELLLKTGSRINETDVDRQSDSLLINAVLNNNLEMVLTLLDYGANVVQLKNDSAIFNALAAAAHVKSVPIARALHHAGAIFSDTNSTNTTLLMLATSIGDFDTYLYFKRMFQAAGIDICTRDAKGNNALIFPIRNNNYEIFDDLVLDGEIACDAVSKAAVAQEVALHGNLKFFRLIAKLPPSYGMITDMVFEQKWPITEPNGKNETLLCTTIIGVRKGFQGTHIDIVNYLLLLDASVNVQCGEMRQTPLMLAAQLPKLDIANILLKVGANISLKDANGRTAFFYAVKDSNFEMVQLLTEKGDHFSVNLKDKLDMIPFFYAAQNCDPKILDWLFNETSSSMLPKPLFLSKFCNVDAHGYTPLMYAAKNGCVVNAIYLLAQQDTNCQMDSALGLAIFAGHFEIARLILERYPTIVNQVTNNTSGMAALHFAAYLASSNSSSRRDFLKFLLSLNTKIKIDTKTNAEITPLCCALLGEVPLETVATLLNLNATGNILMHDGWTPLMFAAARGNAIIVRLLIERGNADVKVEGDITPLLVAAAFGHVEVVRLLIQYNGTTYAAKHLSSFTYNRTVQATRNEMVELRSALVKPLEFLRGVNLPELLPVNENDIREARYLFEKYAAEKWEKRKALQEKPGRWGGQPHDYEQSRVKLPSLQETLERPQTGFGEIGAVVDDAVAQKERTLWLIEQLQRSQTGAGKEGSGEIQPEKVTTLPLLSQLQTTEITGRTIGSPGEDAEKTKTLVLLAGLQRSEANGSQTDEDAEKAKMLSLLTQKIKSSETGAGGRGGSSNDDEAEKAKTLFLLEQIRRSQASAGAAVEGKPGRRGESSSDEGAEKAKTLALLAGLQRSEIEAGRRQDERKTETETEKNGSNQGVDDAEKLKTLSLLAQLQRSETGTGRNRGEQADAENAEKAKTLLLLSRLAGGTAESSKEEDC